MATHMTSREFFQIVYDHLTEDGVLVINVGRAPTDRRLIDGLVSTIETVFPSVFVMDVPGSFNSVVYATLRPAQALNLYYNFNLLKEQGDIHPLLLEAMQTTIVMLQPTPQNAGIVYTDDWAPIEWITNNMVLNFVFFGDKEVLH